MAGRIRALNRVKHFAPAPVTPVARKLPGIKLVVFDVYGTLVDSGTRGRPSLSEPEACRRMVALLRRAGMRVQAGRADQFIAEARRAMIARAHARARTRGVDWPEVDMRVIWERVLRAGIREGALGGAIAIGLPARLALEYEGMRNPVALLPGAKDALAFLRARGIRMAVVSNAQYFTPLILEILLGMTLNAAGFDRRLCAWSYRLGRAKPSPLLIRMVLDRARRLYGIKPAETLSIGNKWENDLAPALALGCRTALLAGSARSFGLPAGEVERLPADLVLTHWSQLEKALG